MKHSVDFAVPVRHPRDVVGSIQRMAEFNDLVTLLRYELAEARQLYEEQPASELNRGQVRGIISILDLLTTGTRQ